MNLRTVSSILVALPLVVLGISANAAPIGPTPAATVPNRQLAASYGKLPLSFEPNQGQTDARVRFLSRGAGYTLYLGPTSATFALQQTDASSGARMIPGQPPQISQSAVVRMDLIGADANSLMQPEDKLPGTASYMNSRDRSKWISGLPTFQKTRTIGVYPGIDLVYYGTQGSLEYDFVLAPHADPGAIRLAFDGATPVVDSNGDLVLSLEPGNHDIHFHKPSLYQQINGVRTPVRGAFTIAANHQVGFRVDGWDHSRELVIDPVLLYSSYLGGSSQTSVPYGMTINAAGEIFVTGRTYAVDYPTTTGVISPHCPAPMTGATKCGPSSESAAFVSRIAAGGQSLVYSTYLGGSGAGPGVGGASVSQGGSGADFGMAVAIDSSNNAWVAGVTNSNNFPITSDAYELYCSPSATDFNFNTSQYEGELSDCARYNGGGEYVYGAQSAFLVKLNPTGTQILYGTFLGGTDTNQPQAVALDANGNVYVAGETSSFGDGPFASNGRYDFPTTPSAFLNGAAYNTGNFNFNSGLVGFLSEFSPDGKSLLYSTLFNGSNGGTWATNLAVSGVGRASIGGFTLSTDLPTTPGAVKNYCIPASGSSTRCGGYNGFVATFDTTKSGAASLVMSTYLSGDTPSTTDNYVSGLAADASGNLFVAGPAPRFDFPTTPGALQTSCNHSNSGNVCEGAFVTELSPSGQLAWSTFYTSPSSNGQSNPPVLAIDAHNNVYISALDDGGGDIPLKHPFQSYQSGFAYVTEISNDGSQVLFGSYFGGGTAINPYSIAVDAAQNIYLTGSTGGSLPLVKPFQSTAAGGFAEGFFAKIQTQFVPSTTKLTVSPTTATAGANVSMTATVTGSTGFATPTGTVTFTSGSAVLGTMAVGTGGVAKLSSTTIPAGKYHIVANYSGDEVYNPSVSAQVGLTITSSSLHTTTTALTISPASATYGALSKLTATVTHAGVAGFPAGTVTFAEGEINVGSATLNGSGVATLNTALPAGMGTIQASYSGSATDAISISPAVSVNVAKAKLTVTAKNVSRPFGTANPIFTYTITGFVNGDTSSVVSDSAAANSTATTRSVPGTYPITFTTMGLTAANYTFTYVGGTLTVTSAPVASLSATSVAFGNQSVGVQSALQTVTLTNTGDAALAITSIKLTGANASSFLTSNTCPTSLAVNASCTLRLRFQPKGKGALTAALTLTDNAPNSPQSITLTGTGQ